MKGRYFSLAAALAAAALLAGCADSRQEAVAQWMAQEKSRAVPKVQPLDEPTVFHPTAYERGDAQDPFAFEKLASVFATGQAREDTRLIERHRNRRKEPLEAYPLDSIEMVGFMQRGSAPTALVRVDGHLYQVGTGAFLGQNNGEIVAITETQIQLSEVVQDATGDWVARSTVLELQE